VKGWPFDCTVSNMRPPLRFELWGITMERQSASARQCCSNHVQSSSGVGSSIALGGSSGTFLLEKMMLRWRLAARAPLWVHSTATKLVNPHALLRS
jgi:hypothetical protein